jgi:hypothetical protein
MATARRVRLHQFFSDPRFGPDRLRLQGTVAAADRVSPQRKYPPCLTNPIGRAFSKPPLPYINFMMTFHP